MTNKNNVIAVCTPCTVVFRSSLMSVIVTFMFEPAKLQMNWASANGNNARRSTGDIRPPLTACDAVTTAAPIRYRDGIGRRRPRLPEPSTRSAMSATLITVTILLVTPARKLERSSRAGIWRLLVRGSEPLPFGAARPPRRQSSRPSGASRSAV